MKLEVQQKYIYNYTVTWVHGNWKNNPLTQVFDKFKSAGTRAVNMTTSSKSTKQFQCRLNYKMGSTKNQYFANYTKTRTVKTAAVIKIFQHSTKHKICIQRKLQKVTDWINKPSLSSLKCTTTDWNLEQSRALGTGKFCNIVSVGV